MFDCTDTVHVDLNDSDNLDLYNQLFAFKDDYSREAVIFPSTLTAAQRRVVHTLAHSMHLEHNSHGLGDQRQVHVYRSNRPSPPAALMSTVRGSDAAHRSLNRAATIDFSEARGIEQGNYNVLRGQQSSGLLGIPDSPGFSGHPQNLRGVKSVADLRSITPSPVTSANGFSHQLVNNVSRFQEYGPGTGVSGTPITTPTLSNGPFSHGGDSLVNGFNSMSLNRANGESPRRLRSMFSFHEEPQQATNGPSSAGAIGSNRSVSINNYDNTSRDRGLPPVRQPAGPGERGHSAFSRGRQNGHQQRGSDELARQQSNVDIIVE